GERGREVVDFLEESLGAVGLSRAVVVCATSDAPSLVRLKAAFVATAIAEYFRDQGKRVLFMLDSITRVARAQREVGLAAGGARARGVRRGGGGAASAARLPAQRVRAAAAPAGTDRDERARIDHRALHR